MNTCQMCKYYTAPGWIINAWQIVACFECNPGNRNGLEKPKSLAITAEGQATYEDRTRGLHSVVDSLEDYK